MIDLGVLRELGTAVLGAAGVLALARAVRLPPLLGYLVAGLLLGPATGLLAVTESLDLLAHLGVALLLFLVGLELSVDRIREVGRTAAVVGTAQMAATLLLGGGLALGLGFPPVEALFLGLAVTFSSTVVVVKLLDEAGDIGTRYGRLSVGVLLVQDVGVALALTVVAGMGGAGESASLARQLGISLLGLVALVAAAAAAVRWGLGRALDWLWELPEAAFIASLTWALLMMLAAKATGLSVELGAFVAGVAVAQLPRAHDLHRRVRPLVDFLLAVFFVALGAGIDLGAAVRYGGAVLALSALVLVGKPLILGGLLGAAGESDRTGLRAALTLGQISEFAFVLTAGAVTTGLVGGDLFSVVGAVGLITIGVSAATAPLGDRLHGLLRRRGRGVLRLFGRDAGGEEAAAGQRSGHAIVVGMNALGREVVRSLAGRGEEVLAVDTDPEKLRGLPADTVLGDVNLGVVLEEIGLARARLVVSALHIEDTNRLLVHRCRAAGVPVAVNVFDSTTAEEMRRLGADHLILSKREEAGRMAERAARAAAGTGR